MNSDTLTRGRRTLRRRVVFVHMSGSLSGRIVSPQLQDPATLTRTEYLKVRCYELAFGWQCCRCWVVFARFIELFITDAFVDMFITICIVVNTAFMALDHAGMSTQMAHTLKMGNYVRTHICFDNVPIDNGVVFREYVSSINK